MLTLNTNVSNLKIINESRKLSQNMNNEMEKLSSGQRVNHSSDDASGLSISTRLQSQTIGNQKSIQDIDNGISVAQIADDGLNSITQILQRMRELLLQADNGTLSDEDKGSLNIELQTLKNEINGIATNTNFNGVKPLYFNTVTAGTGYSGVVTVAPGEVKSAGKITVSPGDTKLHVDAFFGTLSGAVYPDLMLTAPNGETFGYLQDYVSTKNPSVQTGFASGTQVNYSGWAAPNEYMDIYNPMVGDWTVSIGNGGGTASSTFTVQSNLPLSLIGSGGGGSTTTDNNGDIVVHDGYQANSTYSIERFNATTSNLGIDSISTDSHTNIQDSLLNIDEAINKTSMARAKFGASMNILNEKRETLQNSVIETQTANSRIMDTDMAKETSELVKNKMLMNSTFSMMAQSNQQMQSFLELLK